VDAAGPVMETAIQAGPAPTLPVSESAESGYRMRHMEMRCAECGCLVDAGRVVKRCDDPDCCCRDLPDKS
jgi:hypothetical protein